MENKIKAIVKGQYQYPNMKEPKQFEFGVIFTMYPPEKDKDHYGTGYYMGVDIADTGEDDHLIDVRYAGTTDIKKLAAAFIKDHWGMNLREYHFAQPKQS